jgi:hypothetical protein
LALVEIKSHDHIEAKHVEALQAVGVEYPEAELFCLSLDSHERHFDRVHSLPWQKGLDALGLRP